MALTQMIPSRWFGRETTPAVGSLSPRSTVLRGSDDPFIRMHETMDRLFDSLFDSSTGWSVARDGNGRMLSLMTPELDIAETDKAYQLAVDLPGVNAEDIELSAEEDALVIRAERKEHKDEEGVRFHRVERRTGRFERMLTLPGDADTDNISAEFKNGVLEITVPRLEDVSSTRGRRIEIKHD